MASDRNGTLHDQNDEEDEKLDEEVVPRSKRKSKSKSRESYDSDSEEDRKHARSDKRKKKSRKRSRSKSDEKDSDSDSESESESYDSDSEEDRKHARSDKRKKKSGKRSRSKSDEKDSDSESESEYSSSSSEEEERRRRKKRKERKRRREREEERERKRRKREKEERKKKKEKKKKEKLERGKRGAVTNSWGKYGIIRETDMWNKRPEFTAWLAEVKQVNLESLPNWEEKQMFKEFMEDHNTATFPSKKYYDLDAYHKREMEKDIKKGMKKVLASERTVFNDEEQRRLELLQAREKQKEKEVETLKRAMQSGMAQAMKEQARLKEEMAYQYKLGNFEAAAAIQRRLDPDIAM